MKFNNHIIENFVVGTYVTGFFIDWAAHIGLATCDSWFIEECSKFGLLFIPILFGWIPSIVWPLLRTADLIKWIIS